MAFVLEIDGARSQVEIVCLRPLRLRVDGVECEVTRPDEGEDGRQHVEIDGRSLSFTRLSAGARQILRYDGRTHEAALVDEGAGLHASAGAETHVRAPMPGAVVQIHKRPGDAVARGDALVTIESMKLQMTLNAPRDGVLALLSRAVGETFDRDEIVAELEPLEGH